MIAKFIKHLNKAERGQSIIILAIAFVVLLGFVGLTTDVSIMFVRYATIRRAVDSASLAAATQMRQGTEEAAVAIAARQFVEFHGLDSVKVLVDTCQTLDRASPEPEVAVLVEELCTEDQRKLVKVTVQAESPTVFLRLLGWENFTLQASALSETAALDVVLIMDVSESMLLDTDYDDWARIGMGWAFIPPHADDGISDAKGIDDSTFWTDHLLSVPQAEVNARLWYSGVDAFGSDPFDDIDYDVESIRLDDFGAYDEEYGFPADASAIVPREDCRVRFWPNAKNSRVTSFPGRDRRDGGSSADDASYPDNLALYEDDAALGYGLYGEYGSGWPYSATVFNGFVPTYNYYACCNDPGQGGKDDDGNIIMSNGSADFDFTDLICQPFKGARDAVELFLEKIDFIRGDRVAFVTFDRTAFLINPWNQAGQEAGGSHMIDRYDYALQTLRTVVGVRAEPNFYVWDDTLGDADSPPNAGWGALAAGINRIDGVAASQGINYNHATGDGYLIGHGTDADAFYSAPDQILYHYPVVGNCEFQNAALDAPYSSFNGSLGQVSLPYPQNKSHLGADVVWNSHRLFNISGFGDIRYNNGSANPPDPGQQILTNAQIAQFSYDLWANCRGTNIGAALREGNNALLDPATSRRFGAIWVMVLLGDGAAGASDPVRRNGDKLDATLPYIRNDSTGALDPQPGEYGAFGVCPYGSPTVPGEVVATYDDWQSTRSVAFPYCSDQDPDTRHECDFRPDDGVEEMKDSDYVENPNDEDGNPILDSAEIIEWNSARGNLYDVDIADCSDYYDVDDYARDWADFIALQDPGGPEELLPTIYTIGFGLTFGGDSYSGVPEDYTGDYLGEQMLRYIADVGDNNQLDNDYYQNFAENGSLFEPTLDDGFGIRDACQVQDTVPGATGYDFDNNGFLSDDEIDDMYEPLEPTENCGNYFNAPTADELEFVFDSIASKLFTRLAG